MANRTAAVVSVLPVALALVLLWSGCRGGLSVAQEAPALGFRYEPRAAVFERWEMAVSFGAALGDFERVADTQAHDAYDADRDGAFVRLSAEFRLDEKKHRRTVPGFAMRERADGPWQWRVRWSPDRPGLWSVRVRFEGCSAKGRMAVRIEQDVPERIDARVAAKVGGPLVAPTKGQNPRYLRRALPDGRSEAVWFFGACRAWVATAQDPNNDWSPDERIDREKELLGPMREAGFNLLNQWMAPWEFLIVHYDRAEFWQEGDGAWRRVPRPKPAAWSPYQCYDQGRALAFDRMVGLCEGGAGAPTVHLLLSPLPHQCLQVKEHPWGGQESGWSPENDAGKQTPERLNGFSGFKEKMALWEFFEADPHRPLADWRSRLFDHQANFFRYLFARWGYSRAVGIWVLVDELDAVGEEVGVMSEKKGWWAHPQCDRWLADIVRLFRGQLDRSDGTRYQGDPFNHPVHAATTSFGGQAGRGSNLEWAGGPADARPDLFGWHWYPSWRDTATWTDIWTYTVDGVARYSAAPIGTAPRLVSEFGAPDRSRRADAPSALYPSLYHFAIWSGVFAGHAGTPMDWDDGKEFGELRWRERKGIFDKEHYPIDHTAEVKALRMFLGELSPEHLAPTEAAGAKVQCVGEGGARGFALYPERDRVPVTGWVFAPERAGRVVLKGLPVGKYQLRWYDPWTGLPVSRDGTATVAVSDDGAAALDPGPVLRALAESSPPFPAKSRLARGHDVAFKLEPIQPEQTGK